MLLLILVMEFFLNLFLYLFISVHPFKLHNYGKRIAGKGTEKNEVHFK